MADRTKITRLFRYHCWGDQEIKALADGLLALISGVDSLPEVLLISGHFSKAQVKKIVPSAKFALRHYVGVEGLPFIPPFLQNPF